MLTKKLYRTRSTSTSSAVRGSQLFMNEKFTGSKLTTNFSRESLPVLLSSEEQDNVLKIKPLFRALLESISVFISHNCSTPQIRSQMEKGLTNVDRYFVPFYNQLNKNGGSAICFSKLPAQTNLTLVIKNSALPFMKHWTKFTDSIKDIELNGIKYIQDSIDKNFNSILSNLDNIMKYESYNAGIHDPVMKYIKKFQQQIWMFQSLIGKFFLMNRNQRNRAQEKIVQDMKTFSREISTAYSTEFEKYVKGQENEKLKNSSYNAVCDIISEIRAVILYDEDLSKIEQNLVPLNPIFQTIAENLNIAKTEEEIMKIEEEKSKEIQNEKSNEKLKSDKVEVYFDKELNIRELINRGMIAFKRPKLTSDRKRIF
ncbi:hypothetical protein TVAG_425510 [Trichomonas vaginalis G3]|uniref:Uncharacterized protein n=1 Tax=Trichomonas vaginalis (strain ATCC PRA-98 / G3) TaxID=412133 RepID=A2FI85_TRIV3|nr:WD40 repeat-containing protein [Trichomonas vaginalis G3]EAX95367.1 hypothetical protein TVAG_425510 [Trichomonas vaginalis G3]KAI5510734.1 WD40 repeat-containing protein [Trichomonas vaginalis G3]|eukprot:XP_001308297.1 hypothetical protein [Trichomonas vaginalis G3]